MPQTAVQVLTRYGHKFLKNKEDVDLAADRKLYALSLFLSDVVARSCYGVTLDSINLGSDTFWLSTMPNSIPDLIVASSPLV